LFACAFTISALLMLLLLLLQQLLDWQLTRRWQRLSQQ
jgi:hypothetical protein